MSRVGKLPVAIPAGVKVTVSNGMMTVEGPKGKLSQDYDSSLIDVKVEEKEALVSRKSDSKVARSKHGLYRCLLNNMVVGVSAGFTKSLVINGVGYRAEVQGKQLVMNLGYSTDFIAAIPEDLTVTVDGGNKIIVTGIDKQRVGEFSAELRTLRMPEPYKGKGIRYENEVIRRKVGKSGVK